MTDRVQVLKTESAENGGDQSEFQPYPTPIQPQEDMIECAGVYLQDSNNRDENIFISRLGNSIVFSSNVSLNSNNGSEISTTSGSLSLSPYNGNIELSHNSGALLKWSNSSTPTQSGELGMDLSTGRLRIYSDGSIRSLAYTDEISGGGAPADASYLVLSSNGNLNSERVLTAGSGISITDGGAGGSLTIAATGGGSGALTLVESKVVTWATQTLTFSNLDGNSDKIYRVFLKRGNLSQNQGAASIRPNGSTSGLSSRIHYWYPGAHGIGNESVWGLGFTSATYSTNSHLATELTIMAKAGSYRFMNASINYHNVSDHVAMNVFGLWQNTTDNITSLDFYMPTAWPVGTEIHLFKIATS